MKKVEQIKNDELKNLKQINSLYLRYNTGKLIHEESKKTNKSKSEIVQSILDEYFAKRESTTTDTA